MPEPVKPIAERKRALIAGLLFSVFMTLAFPPFGLWGFAFISITPLVWCAWTTERPLRAALFAGLGSAPFWAFEHRWLIDVTLAGYPLVVVDLSLYPALFVWIAARLRRRGGFWAKPAVWFVAAALIWSGLETLRGEVVFYGYPWFYVGHPLIDAPYLPQNADNIGAAGVSLFIAAIGCLLTTVVTNTSRSWIGLMIIVVLTVLLGWNGFITEIVVNGYVHIFLDNQAHIAVIQTNVPQNNKINWSIEQKRSDFDRFVSLTRLAADGRDGSAPDLIVWPETMFPGMTLDPDAIKIERSAQLIFPDGTPTTIFHDELLALQRELGIPMLVGALGIDGLRIEIDDATSEVSIDQDALYNSAFLLNDGAVTVQRYDKIHLTPFGEVMPYISASDWLESKLLDIGARGMSFDLDAGNDPSVLRVPLDPLPEREIDPPIDERPETLRVATPICFEATMPGVMRRLVFDEWGDRRADVIVQLSNDGWFGDWRGGREQHLQLCRWRAIELRTTIIRAVNTGISAIIGVDGRVDVRSSPDASTRIGGLGEPADGMIVRGEISIVDFRTRYVRTGHWIPRFTLAFTALVLIVPMVPRGARRDRSTSVAVDSESEGPPDAHADPSDAPPARDPPLPTDPDPGGSD